MSRSYKHTPRAGDKKDKFFKKYANHKVRHLPMDEHPTKGKIYKKVYHSYGICDYQTVGISFEKYWERLVKRWHEEGCDKPFPDREIAYKDYCRWFRRK